MKFYEYYGDSSNFDQLFTREYGDIYAKIKDLDLNHIQNYDMSKMLPVNDENTLKTIASIILVIGCIFVVVALVGGMVLSNQFGVPYIAYIVVSIIILFFTVGLWAFLRVIGNMSVSMKTLVYYSENKK